MSENGKRSVAFAAAKRDKAIAFAKSGGESISDLEQEAMNALREMENDNNVAGVEDAMANGACFKKRRPL